MKNRILRNGTGLFLALAALVWALPARAQSAAWEEFKSYEGRFRVLAPGPMQHRVDSLETPVGKLAHHTFFYQPPKTEESTADNLLYLLTYCDYPENTVHSDSAELLEEFFAVTIEEAVKSVKGELAYASPQDYFGYPGRVWRIDYIKGQAVIKSRAVVVGSRYYSLQTAMARERSLNPSANRFLDSLRLLE